MRPVRSSAKSKILKKLGLRGVGLLGFPLLPFSYSSVSSPIIRAQLVAFALTAAATPSCDGFPLISTSCQSSPMACIAVDILSAQPYATRSTQGLQPLVLTMNTLLDLSFPFPSRWCLLHEGTAISSAATWRPPSHATIWLKDQYSP